MKNLLLSQLGDDDFNRLEPYLKITPFTQHTVLFEAEQEIRHVYFPTGAVVSLVVTLIKSAALQSPKLLVPCLFVMSRRFMPWPNSQRHVLRRTIFTPVFAAGCCGQGTWRAPIP